MDQLRTLRRVSLTFVVLGVVCLLAATAYWVIIQVLQASALEGMWEGIKQGISTATDLPRVRHVCLKLLEMEQIGADTRMRWLHLAWGLVAALGALNTVLGIYLYRRLAQQK